VAATLPNPPEATPAPAAPLVVVVTEKAQRPHHEPEGPSVLGILVGLLYGPRVRFLAGAALMVFTALWMAQNDLIPGEELDLATFSANLDKAKPLGFLTGWPAVLLSGFNPAGAGLLLVLSALSRTGKIIFFLTLAAGVALAGHLVGIPDIGPVKAPYVSLIAAAAVAQFGIVFESAARGY
jgi:hypothetical protein